MVKPAWSSWIMACFNCSDEFVLPPEELNDGGMGHLDEGVVVPRDEYLGNRLGPGREQRGVIGARVSAAGRGGRECAEEDQNEDEMWPNTAPEGGSDRTGFASANSCLALRPKMAAVFDKAGKSPPRDSGRRRLEIATLRPSILLQDRLDTLAHPKQRLAQYCME